jgi:hypothetical protein
VEEDAEEESVDEGDGSVSALVVAALGNLLKDKAGAMDSTTAYSQKHSISPGSGSPSLQCGSPYSIPFSFNLR